MDQADQDRLAAFFGEEAAEEDWRYASYQLLERFVDTASNEDCSVDTASAIVSFQSELASMSDEHISFLLCHSGCIPDHYPPDSSQETLHTKLTEVLVAHWGTRLGINSTAQSAKSSKEDVTLNADSGFIVCDAKSFRLGRSQPAPNVKDTIKQGDYAKWLQAYPEKRRIGGLVTFPSLHDWKSGSDVYLYVTDPRSVIMLLFYEHLAYLLRYKDRLNAGGGLASLYSRHKDIFTGSPSRRKGAYWGALLPELKRITGGGDLEGFLVASVPLIKDAVSWAKARLEARIEAAKSLAEKYVERLSDRDARVALSDALAREATGDLQRLLRNIEKHRLG